MSDITDSKMARVRALLAKAEDKAATEQEAETYRAKAFELMAAYGIERAMLADKAPGSDKPIAKKVDILNPWSLTKASMFHGLAGALRCETIRLTNEKVQGGTRLHVFGYESDIERLDVLFTSLVLQLSTELRRTPVPHNVSSKVFRRGLVLGFSGKVVQRVKDAESYAERAAASETGVNGRSGALVLVDRKDVIARDFKTAYPRVKMTTRSVNSRAMSGYLAGQEAGARANIGGTGLGRAARGSIGS